MILRIVVGNKTKPLFTGETHTQDFTDALRKLISFPAFCLKEPQFIQSSYKWSHDQLGSKSTAIIEYKDLM
jgi:hypothetical protein